MAPPCIMPASCRCFSVTSMLRRARPGSIASISIPIDLGNRLVSNFSRMRRSRSGVISIPCLSFGPNTLRFCCSGPLAGSAGLGGLSIREHFLRRKRAELCSCRPLPGRPLVHAQITVTAMVEDYVFGFKHQALEVGLMKDNPAGGNPTLRVENPMPGYVAPVLGRRVHRPADESWGIAFFEQSGDLSISHDPAARNPKDQPVDPLEDALKFRRHRAFAGLRSIL